MDQFALFLNHPWAAILVDRIGRVFLILAIVIVCAKLIGIISARILKIAQSKTNPEAPSSEREKRLATVTRLVATFLRVMLVGAAVLMTLREFGLDITPLLTGAGIAGVAVGLGSQSLIKDMISGFFLLIEDQVRVGDVIRVNTGLSGTVERMELRVTAIRDVDGTLHIIPNGEIKSVSNMTYEFAQAVVSIPIKYQASVPKLVEALEEVVQSLEADPKWKPILRSRPTFSGITAFEPTFMNVQLTVKTEPHSRAAVANELRKRAKLALDSAGITLPG